MTHLERSKAVAMACYAPLLCNAEYVNWKPDLLWFNNHEILKTPNYYVQKLFMENQGTDEVIFEKCGLDEIIELTDEKNITGKIAIAGNDIEGQIRGIKVTDFETGDVVKKDDISVEKDNFESILADMRSGHYRVSFRFRRTAGRKGLNIFFGQKDENNRLKWEFGGWDNWDCNLNSYHASRGSVLSQRIFNVGDMEYFLELEVEGRRICTWVNGTLYNDAVDRGSELEELYITASVDRDNDRTILKAVNLTGEEKNVKLLLDGEAKNNAVVTSLKGHGLDETNTFKNPDNILPKTEQFKVNENELTYAFAPHSVTVIAFGKG